VPPSPLHGVSREIAAHDDGAIIKEAHMDTTLNGNTIILAEALQRAAMSSEIAVRRGAAALRWADNAAAAEATLAAALRRIRLLPVATSMMKPESGRGQN
jgi:hypothetical protein